MIDDYDDIAEELARYFYGLGVCQNPDEVQVPEVDTPGVFIDEWYDSTPAGLLFSVTAEDREKDDVHPDVYVRVVCRGTDYAQAQELSRVVFQHLHDVTHIQLTARSGVLLSRRVIRGRLATDENGRYQRVDTYRVTPSVRKKEC